MTVEMDRSARAAALVTFNELGEEEIDRRAVLHLEEFQEREGREMTDLEFNTFLHCRQRGIAHCPRHGFVTLDPIGSEQFCPAASAMETIAQL